MTPRAFYTLFYPIFSRRFLFLRFFVLFLGLRRVLCIISVGGATAHWPPPPTPISGDLQTCEYIKSGPLQDSVVS